MKWCRRVRRILVMFKGIGRGKVRRDRIIKIWMTLYYLSSNEGLVFFIFKNFFFFHICLILIKVLIFKFIKLRKYKF